MQKRLASFFLRKKQDARVIKIKVGLIANRHEGMPVQEFVYEKAINNPANKNKLQMVADNWVYKKIGEMNEKKEYGRVEVHLYSTGFTPALICTLNACRRVKWKVYVYCWNSEKQNYFALEVK